MRIGASKKGKVRAYNHCEERPFTALFVTNRETAGAPNPLSPLPAVSFRSSVKAGTGSAPKEDLRWSVAHNERRGAL